MLKTVYILSGAFVLLTALSASVRSQTTIFNIPTSDTLQQGIWNLEFDCVAKPVRYRDGGYQTFGYRLAYGVTNKTEVGANSYYTWDGTRVTPNSASSERSIRTKNMP